MQLRTSLQITLLALAVSVATPASAIFIGKDAFTARGGDLNDIESTVSQAFYWRQARALQSPFDASAVLGTNCNATWLGNEGRYAWFLTNASCVNANQATRTEITERAELQGEVIAEGKGWAFIPPDRINSSRSSTNIALVKLPMQSPEEDWEENTRPVLYDGDSENTRTTHLVGHGQWGVGLKAVDAQPEKGLPRRLWMQTVMHHMEQSQQEKH